MITKRAVLYVGFKCNLSCEFCYYTFCENREWRDIEECKGEAEMFREFYGNEYVDITGGEPTIYPHIVELVAHCSEIGLKPTLISNCQALWQRFLSRLKDAGLNDFLCSVHGIGKIYDSVVSKQGAWHNVENAIRNINSEGISWRANCTIVRQNCKTLKDIAEWCYTKEAKMINFIDFNPFYSWEQHTEIDFQATHSEIEPHLIEALEFCKRNNFPARVRYFPFCHMKGYEELCVNFAQLPYDEYEWDFRSWYSEHTNAPAHHYADDFWAEREILEAYNEVAKNQRKILYVYADGCKDCSMRMICDGLKKQYFGRFGGSEVKPYQGQIITNPIHFFKGGKK